MAVTPSGSQGSIDGPLSSNLFINGLVLVLNKTMLSNYADDIKFFKIEKDIDKIKATPTKDFGMAT